MADTSGDLDVKTSSARRAAGSAALLVGLLSVLLGLPEPAQAASYDLVVSAVQPHAQSGVQATGTHLTFKATIKNRGAAATPRGVVHGVAFWVDGVFVSWSDYYAASVPAGGSVTVSANGGPAGSATWLATTGRHTLTAQVDDTNRLPGESNETNNTRRATFGVSPVKPVVALSAVPGLTEDEFRSTHGKNVLVSWTAPAGQPVGTRYVVREHPELWQNGAGFCQPGPDVIKATTWGAHIATQITSGAYCPPYHGYGYRVSYVVESRVGDTIASAASGICDWSWYKDAGGSGGELWNFSCDGAPPLSDACARVDCPTTTSLLGGLRALGQEPRSLAVRTGREP